MRSSLAVPACLAATLLAACGPQALDPDATPKGPAGPSPADAQAFLKTLDGEARDIYRETAAADWIAQTYITDDTQLVDSKANERLLAVQNRWLGESRKFDGAELPAADRRQFTLLRLNATAAPGNPKELAELTAIGTRLQAEYGAGKYCRDAADEKSCRNLDQLSKVLAKSRDYGELLDAWRGWRTISPPMRKDYARFVELMNLGAKDLRFADNGEMWRSRYDMDAAGFEKETDRLWGQVKPLYEQLHCYVRGKLSKKYGKDKVPADGMIPAHLLGNMWAQEWGNIYDLVAPFPGATDLDVSAAMARQKWDEKRTTQSAESFYVSLGFPQLPESFWQRSMLKRPADRDVVCHASAWDIDLKGDVRIKMCIEQDETSLMTVYHELGHVYYYLMYEPQPYLFQQGAHDGFHEGIGDTMMLALTPSYLKSIGLVSRADTSAQSVINRQMKMALDKVAFLPFGKLIDQWRWDVFSGRTTPENYNAAWWKLVNRYQGVAAPVPRSENDFDPGAKYHIPANVPYVRYFLARILQFQFYKAMCQAAGWTGPLHECTFAGSKEAGAKLAEMLKLGQSEPWPQALEKLTGGKQMDASAILEYFAPLMAYLKDQNEGQSCGWAAPAEAAASPAP
ncbi:MAG TPA: M2 family metallopeptidase [Candidatus Binatia bacterium]|nr:M2 family metallopeptidase [Candidatus Binatia bacterium]